MIGAGGLGQQVLKGIEQLKIGLGFESGLAGKYVFKHDIDTGEQGQVVRIGYVSWAEGIAMTDPAQAVLEERLGYEVELTMADPAPCRHRLETALDVCPLGLGVS